MICPDCDGYGYYIEGGTYMPMTRVDCALCDGTGEIPDTDKENDEPEIEEV